MEYKEPAAVDPRILGTRIERNPTQSLYGSIGETVPRVPDDWLQRTALPHTSHTSHMSSPHVFGTAIDTQFASTTLGTTPAQEFGVATMKCVCAPTTWPCGWRLTLALVIIGLAVLVAVILLVYLVYCTRRRSIPLVKSSPFVAIVSPDQRRVIDLLVNRAAPQLRGQSFDKLDVERIIGRDSAFDQVLYFYFKEQLEEGTLSVDNLTSVLSRGTKL